jgi:hypothetical protein
MKKTVKVYGLIKTTRKQYISAQTIAFMTLGVLFVLSFGFDISPFPGINDTLLVIGATVIETLETIFVLRKFRSKPQKQ